MSKTLSNGLMNLRFMQNTQRAKEHAQDALEQAKIKDEADWEVSQEIKDAWGIGTPLNASTSSVIHEPSYLPFLFTYSTAGTSEGETRAKPKGRRSFNVKGKEAEMEKVETDPIPENNVPESQPSKRLTSISGFRAPLPTKLSFTSSKSVKSQSVQELIRQDVTKRAPAPLTADTPVPSSAAPGTSKAALAGFLKPTGVDAPPSVASTQARSAAAKKKRDRDEAGDGEGKKRKRKKERISDAHTIE
ncbi:uncharacterized protein PHACADRAFT_211640 [Phanerochaete carnosa HHB-10118-sp]|uniref:Uncharacterized protein n=1 Tax=Phanerochaete carnosa (strain HHB-10118-sp) TaxID=650164 RepID=K5VLU8_PHACS|nr:uncharacterized protein PHACADRAFT_211640 [Phanerochaete carnosa HHB-10118-sp]EKM52388.1 hypothetical protein PHACADRAFT_211640 [Phanerochaete carnosa HHB-10118-sp]